MKSVKMRVLLAIGCAVLLVLGVLYMPEVLVAVAVVAAVACGIYFLFFGAGTDENVL